MGVLLQFLSQMCLEIVRFFGVVPIVLPLRHVFFLLVFSRPLCFRLRWSKEREREREIVSFYAQNKDQKRNEREEISNLHVTILNMLYIIPSSLNSSNSSSHSKSTSSFCFFLFCCSFARVSLLLVLVMTFSLLLCVSLCGVLLSAPPSSRRR